MFCGMPLRGRLCVTIEEAHIASRLPPSSGLDTEHLDCYCYHIAEYISFEGTFTYIV